ncbi:MAG: LytTR family transcriptional regulator [Rhodothermia bacterium]|nr:LytTR family transcriptional regulator [Rhodothermia bacterium]
MRRFRGVFHFEAYSVKSKTLLLGLLALLPIVLTVFQDYVEAQFQQYRFYFAESFLFSLIWWLFVPILIIQQQFASIRNFPLPIGLFLWVVLPTILHLLWFPALVWALSWLWYAHTFAYGQTLQYALAEFPVILVLVYGTAWGWSHWQMHKEEANKPLPTENATIQEVVVQPSPPEQEKMYLEHVVVLENGIRQPIPLADIVYLTSQTPYICLHTRQKKHLYQGSLRGLEQQLNPKEVVRIHKSTMVSLREVVALKSRLNGDYDLVLRNNVVLRLSRNYAQAFKKAMNHRNENVDSYKNLKAALPPTLQYP